MVRLLITFLFFVHLEAAPLPVTVSAESAILMNADTGAILYEKKPRQKLFPASITKIATAAYALQLRGDKLNEMMEADQDCIGSVTEEAKQRSNYTLPSYWLVTDCSHMGIKKGELLSFGDLLNGMMIASADDAANVIAQKIGKGSITAFMDEINQYIKDLGCQDTFFNNPHGLHHPKHVTTAYDMALIAKEALKNPQFRKIVASTRYTRPKTNKQESTVLVQTNKLLRKGDYYYPKAIGVKTGRTSKAGHTLVAAAKDQERTLIAVILNAKERKDIFNDAIHLFDAAFDQAKISKTLVQIGPQKYRLELEGGKSISTYTEDEVNVSYFPAEEPKIKAYLQWDALQLPVKKGQKVGEIQLKKEEGKLEKVIPLFAAETVEKNMWSFKLLVIGGIIVLILSAIFLIARRGR